MCLASPCSAGDDSVISVLFPREANLLPAWTAGHYIALVTDRIVVLVGFTKSGEQCDWMSVRTLKTVTDRC